VPVYQWTLPEDVEPLRRAANALARGEVDVVLLTSGVQLAHLWQIVEEQKLSRTSGAASRMVIASIGPTTSEELTRRWPDGGSAGVSPENGHPRHGSRSEVCRPVGVAKRRAGR
jgi:uroporphyrinogen-III synthase